MKKRLFVALLGGMLAFSAIPVYANESQSANLEVIEVVEVEASENALDEENIFLVNPSIKEVIPNIFSKSNLRVSYPTTPPIYWDNLSQGESTRPYGDTSGSGYEMTSDWIDGRNKYSLNVHNYNNRALKVSVITETGKITTWEVPSGTASKATTRKYTITTTKSTDKFFIWYDGNGLNFISVVTAY